MEFLFHFRLGDGLGEPRGGDPMNLELLKHKFTATERLRYMVDNEWRVSKTAKHMPVMDPSTGKQIAEAPCCTQEEVDSAVAAAARAFPAGATRRSPPASS
jgi:hypothetical protein